MKVREAVRALSDSSSVLRVSIFVLLAALSTCPLSTAAAGTGGPAPGNVPQPCLKTDKTAYVAGETITATGSSFLPSEIVTLQAVHSDSTAEPGMGHESWTIAAGADGTFTATWSIRFNDASGIQFVLTAAGAFGSRAQASFTRVAAVTTDRQGYQPGDAAQITGTGFLPQEMVNLQVTPVVRSADNREYAPFTTMSDENGRIYASSNPQTEILDTPLLKLTAEGASSSLRALALISGPFFTVIDQNGANDEPGQKDLTQMGREDNDPDFLKIYWSWDSVDFTSQAGDACALFDSNGNGDIDLAVCGEVANGANFDAANPVINLAALSVWTCGDGKPDRCSQPTAQVEDIGLTNAGVLGSGNPLDSSGNLVAATDPFPTGDFYPLDTTLQVNIDRNFLNAAFPGATFVNVCSYPSIGSGANTDPSDCITTPGGGFLVIHKDAGTDSSTTFTFTVNPVPAGQPGTYPVLGTGSTSSIGIEIGDSLAVTEAVPQGWLFRSASCALQDGTPTGTLDTNGVAGITIQSGLTTTCTFTNEAEAPALSLTKSASPASYDHVGQQIDYTYVLTNSGNVTLDGPFTISDDKTTVTCPATGSLAPEDHITCTASYAVTQADLDAGSVTNAATGQGKFRDNPVQSNQATASVTAMGNPALQLTKSASPETYSKVGDTIAYSYVIKNTGNATLNGPFTVTDDKVTVTCPADNALAPNATVSCTAAYTITQADLDAGSVTNAAVAHAAFKGSTINSTQVKATVNAAGSPVLSLTKRADPTTYSKVDDVIQYSYELKNTGNVTLSGPFTVTDDKAIVTCPASGSLAPGASIACQASYKTSQADLNNGSVTNHAAGKAMFDGKAVSSNQAQATIHAVQSLVLTLTKSASPVAYAKAGDSIEYSYVIKNAGNVILSGPFAVSDDKATVTCPATPAALAPNETLACTASYKITQADMDSGSVTNHATASAKFGENTVTSNQATATVTGVQGKAVVIDKAPESQVVVPGGTATFTITVTNTGNVSLAGVVVSDPLSPGCNKTIGNLAPGASSSYACTATVSSAFTNVATATGNPPAGPSVSSSDSAEVKVASDLSVSQTANPSLKREFAWNITKSVDPTSANLTSGSANFNYTVLVSQTGISESERAVTGKIAVTNPNSFAVTGVQVVGGTDGGVSCAVTGGTNVTIPAGGSVLLDYVCTQPSASAGFVNAVASWNKAAYGTPSGQASAQVPFDFTGNGNITNLNGTVTVVDTFDGQTTTLGTATGTTVQPYTSMTFTYSRSLTAGPACQDHVNTAKIVQTSQSASQTVRVCGTVITSKTGALSKGFWKKKHGQGIIRNYCGGTGGTSLYTDLRRFAPFQDLSETGCAGIAGYAYGVIKAAKAAGPAMNAMLKAQMLATALDVYFSDTALGGNRIKAPGPVGVALVDLTRICGNFDSSHDTATCTGGYQNASTAFGGASQMVISDLLTYAAGQSNVGGSLWYGNVKSTQALAKDVFDAINNQVAP